MRRRVSLLLVVAIALVAVAAAIDGLRAKNEPLTASHSTAAGGATTEPAGDTVANRVGRCTPGQLALVIEPFDGSQAAVLRYRRGDPCRQPGGPITVVIRTPAGAGRGLLLGPEGSFGGLYTSGFEEVAGFRYSPRCGEVGPFVATVRFKAYSARNRIRILRCGIGQQP